MAPDDRDPTIDPATSLPETVVSPTLLDGAPRAGERALLGTVLDGKYRVEALLGRGGMGAVYRATQLQLDRQVAVKVVRGQSPRAAGAVARFKREALTVARLRHPNIIAIYDFGIAPEAGAYLVMEYLEGRTLRDAAAEAARAGGPSLDWIVDVMAQVCSAVHAAHGAGVVHRDLKPDNVVLETTPAGCAVKVLDFGIAKLVEARVEEHASLTQDGTPIGTPAYMAPEQWEAREVDARTDVYALGCMLFELLTGTIPFVARSVAGMVRLHVLEPPAPPSRVRPGIGPALDAVVLRALEKSPEARFPSAAALALALAAAAEGIAPDTVPPRPTPALVETLVDEATLAPADNLPTHLTSFVGRAAHLAAVRRAVAASRLVTLAGPGGIGKTRLAIRAARELLADLPDGAWLVELAPVADPVAVPGAFAAALGVSEEPGRPLVATLVERVRAKRLLLVVDNCEHVVEAAAALCDALLRAGAGVRILATSREVLGLAGEVVWAVPPLDLPSVGEAAEVAASEAVMLFVDRARLAKPGFALTPANASAVATLCERLDGIPLAIELAAARARMLTVEGILEKMGDRFRLLTGGSRTAALRQQTLWAAVDWSHELLTDDEQAIFRRLSVFAGGWTLEAAEAASTGDGIDELAILDLHERLVDKSLVSFEEAGDGVRYRMLETVREYARAKLFEVGEAEARLRRHRDWCRSLAERVASIFRTDQAGAFRLLAAERANLGAAAQWGIDGAPTPEDVGETLRLLATLARFWALAGPWAEGRRWLEGALAIGAGAPAALRADALFGLGNIAGHQSDFARAASATGECLALRRELGDLPGVVRALNSGGLYAAYLGAYDVAETMLRESLDLCDRLGNEPSRTTALSHLGLAALFAGDLERAEGFLEEATTRRQADGNELGAAFLSAQVAEILRLKGSPERALRRIEACIPIAVETGIANLLADLRIAQARALADMGDLDRAFALLGEGARARAHMSRDGVLELVESCARALARRGDWEHAVAVAEAATAARAATGPRRQPFVEAELAHRLAPARAALAGDRYDRAVARGRATGIDEALSLALGGGASNDA